MNTTEHAPATERFWLHAHQAGFLQSLADQGYSERSISTYGRFSSRLCNVAETRGIGPETFDADVMAELVDACPTTGTPCMKQELATVARRFADHLTGAGAMAGPDRSAPASGAVERLCAEMDLWLRSERGMYGDRLRRHPKILIRFLDRCRKDTGTLRDLATVTAEDVLAFADEINGPGSWRLAYLRNILRFLFRSGRMPRDLSAAVPGTPRSRTDGLPRHLDPETVERLLEAIRGESPRDRRDHAMLLLMARLGLRAQEVVAMRIDDIDWKVGRMLVRGKRGQLDHMPVPVDVGEAIVSWLRDGRRGRSRHLFVGLRPPFADLPSSEPVRAALRRAFRLAGVAPPRGQVRTHALRHGLAMRLLNQGSSLEEIGDVLRHRSGASTTAYARHDVETLRELARPWPEGAGE